MRMRLPSKISSSAFDNHTDRDKAVTNYQMKKKRYHKMHATDAVKARKKEINGMRNDDEEEKL